MRPLPRIVVPAVIALLTMGVRASSPAVATQAGPEGAIQAMLDERAAALTRRDRGAFDRTMDGAKSSFAAREDAGFARAGRLPLGEVRLTIDTEEFGNLARASDEVAGFDETRIVQVREKIALRGYDRAPENEDVFLTVVRKGDRWTVYDDEGVDDLGLLSMRHLWDFGEVEITESDGIMVVHHPSERAAAGPVLASAKRARAAARKGWPMPWRDPIVVMIPSTVTEIERILQTTFDLSQFVAFAASSVDRTDGYRLTGNRVFLHWPNFKKYSAAFQEQVLVHEFTHLATRDVAGPWIPAIFDEGIAQYYGEGGGDTAQLRRRVRAGTLPSGLVPDWYFTAGPRNDIFLAYEEAASFIDYLAGRFGRDAGARAYTALGTIDPIGPGTWRYHLDRVTTDLFGQSYPALERAWVASVRAKYS